MNEATKQLIAGIAISLKGGEAAGTDSPGEDGYAEFSVGTTKVKVEPRCITVTFHEQGCDPVALKIDRPKVEQPSFGDIHVGGAGGSSGSGYARSTNPGEAVITQGFLGGGGGGGAGYGVSSSLPATGGPGVSSSSAPNGGLAAGGGTGLGKAHSVGAGGPGFAVYSVEVSIPGVRFPRGERVTIRAVEPTS